jgi:3-oxoacyl-[acyl-carrier protein] reductase
METAMSGALDEEQRQRIHARTALKAPASLESVAATVVFLLGEGAASITGQNLFVDSGTI